MLLDYDQELTLAGGHVVDFAAGSEYGSRPYDLMAAGQDPAVGERLAAFYQVKVATINTLTSLTIAIVNDTDGAGGSEVVVASKSVLQAALLVANGVVRIGDIDPAQIALRYLTLKLTVVGSTPTTGQLSAFLVKGDDQAPQNVGRAF